MENYMIWRLSIFVGFLLALVLVILIAVVAIVGVLLLKKVDRDIEKSIRACECCKEVFGDEE